MQGSTVCKKLSSCLPPAKKKHKFSLASGEAWQSNTECARKRQRLWPTATTITRIGFPYGLLDTPGFQPLAIQISKRLHPQTAVKAQLNPPNPRKSSQENEAHVLFTLLNLQCDLKLPKDSPRGPTGCDRTATSAKSGSRPGRLGDWQMLGASASWRYVGFGASLGQTS